MRPRRVPLRSLGGPGGMLGVRTAGRAGPGPLTGPGASRGVSGITHDSRRVQPGDLYVAVPGSQHHGGRFCGQAASAGAAAILTDPAGKELAIRSGLPVFVVGDPRSRLGAVSSWVYGNPSGKLTLIGVTGTSGKTTTTYLVESGLRAAGHLTGLVGGVHNGVGEVTVDCWLTTPEATDLQDLLAAMVEQGVTAAAMEVSSHALALGRVAGTYYDVALFTNLSQDHLDFHETIDAYFAAKAALFTPGYSRTGVVNIDDEHGRRLAAAPQIPLTTYSAAGNSQADWRAPRARRGGAGGAVPGHRPRGGRGGRGPGPPPPVYRGQPPGGPARRGPRGGGG